ncbi:hypothetical protein N7517_006351 [Penicillium concentricum]|uniref:Uncharacterized protein n=1 Tax=Penicillium concentricum TaxID=293559 RepID=A0A9W9S9K2_9EURO|nr:uncharacterized protein N7517_006351 [Penicillium concentricum]KAJ5374345.1 hypothetical protein N7517_006351 [Penicillium concentricum]
MSEPETKPGSESNIYRIQERWESLNEMFQNTDPEPEEPVGSADDLEAEIRQAQAQLSRLKKQRELIDIKQKVAEEERELERARTRLLAATTLELPPATPASTPSRAEPKQNSKAGIDEAQKNIHPARSEQITNPAPPTQPADRSSDAKPSEPKPSPKPATNLVSGLNLEQLRALAAATRSPAAPAVVKTESRSSLQPSARSFHPESSVHAPPVPNVPVYNGRALGEFKNFSMGLERHFDKYPEWYKIDERKVTRALKHVALNIEDEWKRHIRHLPAEKVTYGSFCTFLIHQLQNGVYPDVARSRYMDSYQRPAQSVTDFSNWMQQWVPHFPNNDSERDRMRHLFEHLMNRVRNEADKTHLDFDNYYEFVEYLQRVEDSIGSRAESLGRRVINPRKRPRSHD